ncbi:MAG: hypothetical protein KDJ20_07860 [Hyphomicrobiales bacterium]|nr:hypothetical protein [Hyphomicrobiales bacterium]MCC2108184.1 hypothetical protein [Hyphomicrobiales bacterium]
MKISSHLTLNVITKKTSRHIALKRRKLPANANIFSAQCEENFHPRRRKIRPKPIQETWEETWAMKLAADGGAPQARPPSASPDRAVRLGMLRASPARLRGASDCALTAIVSGEGSAS